MLLVVIRAPAQISSIRSICGCVLRLQMGGTNYLKVKAVYSDGTVRMVTAEATVNSSDTNVLKVEQAAKLVAVAPGEATVTVTYQSAAGVAIRN